MGVRGVCGGVIKIAQTITHLRAASRSRLASAGASPSRASTAPRSPGASATPGGPSPARRAPVGCWCVYGEGWCVLVGGDERLFVGVLVCVCLWVGGDEGGGCTTRSPFILIGEPVTCPGRPLSHQPTTYTHIYTPGRPPPGDPYRSGAARRCGTAAPPPPPALGVVVVMACARMYA